MELTGEDKYVNNNNCQITQFHWLPGSGESFIIVEEYNDVTAYGAAILWIINTRSTSVPPTDHHLNHGTGANKVDAWTCT